MYPRQKQPISGFAMILSLGFVIFIVFALLLIIDKTSIQYLNSQPPATAYLNITQPTTIPPTPISQSIAVQPTPILIAQANRPAQSALSISDLEVLSQHTYIDGRYLYIVGEVRNNTDNPMSYVRLVATLYDKDAKVTGTNSTFSELKTISPASKSPFKISIEEWTGTTKYKIQTDGIKGILPRQDVVILSHNSYVEGRWQHIKGEVQNTGTTAVQYVKLVVTLYDVDGGVIDMDYGFTTINTIVAQGTSPFDILLSHWSDFDHYDIQVQNL